MGPVVIGEKIYYVFQKIDGWEGGGEGQHPWLPCFSTDKTNLSNLMKRDTQRTIYVRLFANRHISFKEVLFMIIESCVKSESTHNP